MPQIIILYLKKTGELTKSLLFFAGLMILFPKLFIKQRVKVVSITIIVAGSFFLHCGMNGAYALSEIVELNKIVKDAKKSIEQSARADIDMEKILDVDDSEAFPSIEEKADDVQTMMPALGEKIDNTNAEIPNINEKANANVNERKQLNENTEEPMVSVSTERRAPGKEVLKLFNLGVYYQKQGNTVKAIEEYGRVLELDPDNAEAHNNLGVIYKEQNDLDKAEMHFTHIISLNPAMDEAHNNLGLIYYLKGNQRGAMSEFQKALELNLDNLMTQINLGLVYKAQGLDRKAIDAIENVLSIEPFHAEAHYNLAILYEGLGHLERATWHYTRFVNNAGANYIDLTRKVSEHIKELEVASGNILKE